MAEAIWDFALRFYGAPAVEEACLELQENWHADVCVLIYVLWLASREIAVSESEVRTIAESVADWRSHVVQPLRAARIAMRKARDVESIAGDAERLRADIKSLELAAERRELEYLATLEVGARSPDDKLTSERNVLAYLEILGVDDGSIDPAQVKVLAQAA